MPFTRRKLLEYWWAVPVTGTLGALGAMGHYAWRVTFGKQAPGEAEFRGGPAVRVARAGDVQADWATVDFVYGQVPCVLMRVPVTPEVTATSGAALAAGAAFVAYSRVCTHLGCLVVPQRELEALALTYNYRSAHPVLGCPCHFSVFDPLAGGQAVFGRALLPLPRVRLEAQGDVLYATGIEPPPVT